MRCGILVLLLIASGCSDEASSEWIASADACVLSTPRALVLDPDGTSQVVVGVGAKPRLVAYDKGGAIAAQLTLPHGTQNAVRFGDGAIVVGEGAPDGGAHTPFVASIDRGGEVRWVRRLPLGGIPSDVRESGLLGVAINDDTIAVTVTSSRTRSGRLAFLRADGWITAEVGIGGGDRPARVAFDRDGVVIAVTDFERFSVAAFDLAAKPRWRHAFDGSLASLSRCLDGVVVAATVSNEGPRVLRFGPSGESLLSMAIPTAGAVAACDAQGIVVGGSMFGQLGSPPIGQADRSGSYLATFPLEGGPGALRQFGGVHTVIGAIALGGEFVHLTGSYRGTVKVGSSSVTSCVSGSPADDAFVARVRR